MLLIITVFAGASPVIKNSMYTATLLMELVSCVNNRLASSYLILAAFAFLVNQSLDRHAAIMPIAAYALVMLQGKLLV